VLRTVADTRHFSHFTFLARGAELHSFAAKNSQTVENDREKFSGALRHDAGMLRL